MLSPSDSARRVLVTGATGVLGISIVREFIGAGYAVRTFSLDASMSGMFPASVVVLDGDITDAARVEAAMQNVDVVIHLAALLHIENPTPSLRAKYERINVDGTASVVKAARAANVSRVVFFSTIAVYGPTNGRVVNETCPVAPDTMYAQTKYAAEQIVREAVRSDGIPLGTVLRLGAVYGARLKGNYLRLVRSLARRRFVPIGRGLNRRTLVYVDDVARAARLAAEHPAACGNLYNVTDGQIHPLREILDAMCAALGQKPLRMRVPAPLAYAGVDLVQAAGKIAGQEFGLWRSTLDKYMEDVAVDGTLIQRELGFVPQFDLTNGWNATVREMQILHLL